MRSRSLLHFFPPPSFLKPHAAGLDVSGDAFRFIELREKSGHYEVRRFAARDLRSESGEALGAAEKRTALAAFAKEHRLKFVHAALPDDKAYLFTMELPRLEHQAIRSNIEFKLEEQVPVPPSEAVFDYEVLPDAPGPDRMKVSVTVVPQSIVQAYIDLFKGANLVPLSFEIESQALARAIIPPGDRTTHLVVNFASDRTSLSVVSHGVVLFSSSVSVGAQALTSAVEKSTGLSSKEAEAVKREQGLVKTRNDKDVFFSLASALSVLRDEMNRVIEYWRSHEQSVAGRDLFDSIILCGADASLPGFHEYFSLSFDIPVRLGDVWANVAKLDAYTPPIPFAESFKYGVAIGLYLS